MPRIICERYLPQNSQRSPVASIQSDRMVRALDVGCNGAQALLAWIEGGHLKAAFVHNPTDVFDLGLSTANPPHIAAGLDEFAVSWQGDDGNMRVTRIPLEGSDQKTILLNGVQFRSITGMVATSLGYLLAFRHQNTQQVALIEPDFNAWHLVDNSQNWRIFSDYASIDIQEAHTGKMIWQTAESLVKAK